LGYGSRVKREKRLTKREQKALKGPSPGAQAQRDAEHIHCVACGRHLDPGEFAGATPTATRLRCQHGGMFPSCVPCAARSRELLAIHDRTGQPVQSAQRWH
jgi:hypothetical protein